MLNKKGEGEQFNWIFVIVAGAIILSFFVLFAAKYIKLQQDREDVRSVRNFGLLLDEIEKLPLTDNGASIDSNKPGSGLRFGYELDMNYDCIDTKSLLHIGKGNFADYELKNQIVFIKSKQKVISLDMWLLPWRYPYHITNIIYLSEPKRKYYLVYDSNTKEFVDNLEISSVFSTKKVNINNLNTEKDSTYVLFLKQKPKKEKIAQLIKSETINFVYINPDENKGKISFFDEEWSDDVNYYGKELMYGAIFSDDYESYKCNVNKALKKLKDTSNIYTERLVILSQIDNKPECKYDELAETIRKFANGDYKLEENIQEQNKIGAGCLEGF